jgi:hypothetical protein
MGGTVRIDWEAIKARWGSEVDELHLALLPKGAAQLLLAISDRLQWEATYRIAGYDFSDWDELQTIVDLGLGGLTDTVRLSDLLTLVDDIEPLLQLLLDKPCCTDALDGLEEIYPEGLDLVGDELDTTGEDIVADTGDPPAGAADWTEWHSKLCDAAAKYADGLPQIIDYAEILQSIVQGLTLAALAALLASFMPLLGLAAATVGVVITGLDLLAKLGEIRVELGNIEEWENIKQDIIDARQEIICAIITASTPGEASSNVQAALEAANPTGWSIIRMLTFPGNAMRHLFNMGSTVVGGYGSGCGSCEPGFDWVFTWQRLAGADAQFIDHWTNPSGAGYVGSPATLPRFSGGGTFQLNRTTLETLAGGTVTIKRVVYRCLAEADLGVNPRFQLRDGTNPGTYFAGTGAVPKDDSYHDIQVEVDPPITISTGAMYMWFNVDSGNSQFGYIDRLTLYADVS